jgi:heme/copper-type cytochrome/quinol oxidase subunit 2
MSINLLLSTIILVSFLITIVMAVGSYVAYKLREARRPRVELPMVAGESAFFERVTADDR